MKTLTCSWCDAPNSPGATTCASCGAPLREEGARLVMESVARALPPDTVLRDGDYKILAILGQGGFGITYRALNSRLGREVAIKEFFPSSCDREGLLVSPSGGTTALDYENGKAAFLSEARVLARFDHPAIVRVFGAWEENRSAYMEMELLRGQTLAHVLDQYRRLNPNDVLRLFNPILDALQVLHNEGYLHRDIKPQNLMLCGVAQGATDAESCVRHARAVLLDFGAAHHVGSGASQALSVVVTPGYAPLEQYAQRARRGAFTDIYALCATLYHALSGQAPPPASDRAIGQALTPLENLVPGLPKEWYAAIAAGLQTEIAKRPQSVSELRALMGNQNPVAPPPYQPYSGVAKYGDANPLASPSPQIDVNHLNSPAQSLIAQSLLNAVPDPSAPQVLAAPHLNPQHPLGAYTPGQPVALSQPPSAVPLVPPQASQTAQTPYHQQNTAQQPAQQQAQQNSAANDVRMRQVAALLYLGSPIVFALLWWLFAMASAPHMAPPPYMQNMPTSEVTPPMTRPYSPLPAREMSSQTELPKMRFSLSNSAVSSLANWKESSNLLTDTALSPNGKMAVGITQAGEIGLWDVSTDRMVHKLRNLSAGVTAHFAFSPDSSKLMIREVPANKASERLFALSELPQKFSTSYYSKIGVIDVKNGKTLWQKSTLAQAARWADNSRAVQIGFVHAADGSMGMLADDGKSYGGYREANTQLPTLSTPNNDPGILRTQRLKYAPNGQFIAYWGKGGSGGVGLFSFETHGSRILSLKNRPLVDSGVWFSPDSSWLMTRALHDSGQSLQKNIYFYRTISEGDKVEDEMSVWENEPSSDYGEEFDFTISPKGRYVAINNGTHELRLWNVRKHVDLILRWSNKAYNYYGKSLSRDEGQLLGNRLVFSPDESKMILVEGPIRSSDSIKLIDIATRKVSEMESPSGTTNLKMQFAPDGNSISFIDGTNGKMGRLKLSDFKTSLPVQVLAGGPPQP